MTGKLKSKSQQVKTVSVGLTEREVQRILEIMNDIPQESKDRKLFLKIYDLKRRFYYYE